MLLCRDKTAEGCGSVGSACMAGRKGPQNPTRLSGTKGGILLGILVLLSIYMHISNSFFNIHLLFQTDVLLLFSSKDMSKNATLKIIFKYFLDKR